MSAFNVGDRVALNWEREETGSYLQGEGDVIAVLDDFITDTLFGETMIRVEIDMDDVIHSDDYDFAGTTTGLFYAEELVKL